METRKQIYAHIINNNLQEEVKKAYGRNYTQVGNEDLLRIYDKHIMSRASEVKEKKQNVSNKDCKCNSGIFKVQSALVALISELVSARRLKAADAEAILSLLQ
jgi:type II secretory pathway component PulC